MKVEIKNNNIEMTREKRSDVDDNFCGVYFTKN